RLEFTARDRGSDENVMPGTLEPGDTRLRNLIGDQDLHSESKRCTSSPLRNLGSNQVDFGGMRRPASDTATSSSIVVGYMENANSASPASTSLSSSSMPRMPPTKSMLGSRRGSVIPSSGPSINSLKRATSRSSAIESPSVSGSRSVCHAPSR